MDNQPLSNTRLYEQMATHIREQIVSGKLNAGDKLPTERVLAEQFGVSRTVVREAVKTLKREGLIEIRPGNGTFVIDATGEALTHSFGLLLSVHKGNSLRDIVEIREILEPQIVAIAAQRATPDQIIALENAIDRMDAHLTDITDYTRTDHSFHLTLAEATQNFIISRLMTSIVDLLHELRERIALVDGARQRGQVHHRNILKAVKARDADSARKAMLEHLAQVRRDSGIDNEDDEENAND